MKILPFCLMAIHLIFWSSAFGQDLSQMVRFTIDKKVYDELSEAQKNNLSVKSSEVQTFIAHQLFPQIPQEIKEKIKNLKVKIQLNAMPARDGLFIPSELSEHVISINMIQMNSNGIKALIAHELFHAIHFHLNPNEFPWVREGLAQMFEYITTGDLNGVNLAAAILNPFTSLISEYDINNRNQALYGHSQLYFLYLFERCGRENIFWKLTLGNKQNKGSYLIDDILTELSKNSIECKNFDESVIHFQVAKMQNQIQFSNPMGKMRFYITNIDITPKNKAITSEEELKKHLIEIPVLSSTKISFQSYVQFKGQCKNCAIFYANKKFPFDVSENVPAQSANYDVIFVKLQ